jgi:hypothetical protein
MTQAVRILNSSFRSNGWGNTETVFTAGQVLPLSDETQREIDVGNAELIDVPDEQQPQAEA